MPSLLKKTATFAIANVTRSNDSDRQDGRKGSFPVPAGSVYAP